MRVPSIAREVLFREEISAGVILPDIPFNEKDKLLRKIIRQMGRTLQ
jgi:hypothetical protein